MKIYAVVEPGYYDTWPEYLGFYTKYEDAELLIAELKRFTPRGVFNIEVIEVCEKYEAN